MLHSVVNHQHNTELSHPLELLAELLNQRQTQLTTVSLADITTAYLARIRDLPHQNPEQLAGFIELGTKLVYLKSVALLPVAEVDESAEITALSTQLQHYQLVKHMAKKLEARKQIMCLPRPFSPTKSTTATLAESQLDMTPLEYHQSAHKLAAAYAALLRRQPAPLSRSSTLPEPITLEAASRWLDRLLNQSESLLLDDLARHATTRADMIALFLAVLDRLRSGSLIGRLRDTAAGQWELRRA